MEPHATNVRRASLAVFHNICAIYPQHWMLTDDQQKGGCFRTRLFEIDECPFRYANRSSTGWPLSAMVKGRLLGL